MDIVNFDALIAEGKVIDLNDVNPNEDYIIIGKYDKRAKEFKAAKYALYAISVNDLLAGFGGGGSTAGSGLTDNGNLIDLGGLLTQNTYINGNTFIFSVTSNDLYLTANTDMAFAIGNNLDVVAEQDINILTLTRDVTISASRNLILNSTNYIQLNAIGQIDLISTGEEIGFTPAPTKNVIVKIPDGQDSSFVVNGQTTEASVTAPVGGSLLYNKTTGKMMFYNAVLAQWETITSAP